MAKYLSIYHQDWIQSMNEEKIMSHLTKIMVLAPTMLVAFELLYLSDIDDLSTFQFLLLGTILPNGKSEIVATIVHVVNLTLAVVLKIRMELDNQAHNESRGCIHAFKHILPSQTDIDDNGSNGDQLKVVSRVFVISIFSGSWVAYHMTIGAHNLQNNFAFFGFVFNSGLPCIYVYNHNAMRGIAINMMQQWLPEPYLTPII